MWGGCGPRPWSDPRREGERSTRPPAPWTVPVAEADMVTPGQASKGCLHTRRRTIVLPGVRFLQDRRARPARSSSIMTNDVQSIPNVGPAVARKLSRLGITQPDQLRRCDPEDLFEQLCALDGCRHDPCLLDTFVAAVSYANGGPSRPWWEFSRERNARASG
jgi:hypothetical protein